MENEKIYQTLKQVFPTFNFDEINRVPPSGSERENFILEEKNKKFVATHGYNIAENEDFIFLANYLHSKNIQVPEILAISEKKDWYLQSFAGNISLLDYVEKNGWTKKSIAFYQKSLAALIQIQTLAFEKDFQYFFKKLKIFDASQLAYDLNYFKQYFLIPAQINFDEKKLAQDFNLFLAVTQNVRKDFFMYRDFQGRNILLQHEEICFIDFQGAMQGHPLYDVASLLWQAKAKMPIEIKEELLTFYYHKIKIQCESLSINWNEKQMQMDYEYICLSRLLQVLGAYGRRGILEGKKHFVQSIPLALHNLKQWENQFSLKNMPELLSIIDTITQNDFIKKYENGT